MAGRDITEGRASRAVAVDVGVLTDTSVWVNTDIAYDVALGGQPFIYAISDGHPYIRQTAPFRKEQFDNQTEPGEQSLTGWWIRSQSSFHNGTGITFFDPALVSNEGAYRFADSRNVDVWTQGQVTLLNSVSQGHQITGQIQANGKVNQNLRSIKWNNTSGALLRDDYDLDKIASDGTVTHFVDYNAGTDRPVLAVCDDGANAYWMTNVNSGGSFKMTIYSKPLTGNSSTSATKLFDANFEATTGVMEFVKERIVLAADNKVYEFATNATILPSPVYTHPSSTHVYTSIAASGAAIYVSGYNGIQSTILKFTLSSTGLMPTLTQGVIAAEMPTGEVIHKIHYYLGYMIIGTSKGIRVATVSDVDGSINYGPLIVETDQPVYDFCSRDHYVWAATGVAGSPGLIRMDLTQQIEPLVFAYANDVYYDAATGHNTTAVAFADGTDQLLFCSEATGATSADYGYVYIESLTQKATSGYLKTGYIRYNTLEPKNFKRLIGRGDFTYGSMTLETVDADGTESVSYTHLTLPTTSRV